MLRIGQSADVIATQTPKSASSGVAPTPPTPSQKRIITEAEILGTQTPKGPTPRKVHRYQPNSNSQPKQQNIFLPLNHI